MKMKRTRNYADDYDYVDEEDDDSLSSESGDQFNRRLKVKLAEESGVDDQESDHDSPQPPMERKHFCVICNKQFSSGKAYGGHVRIHSSECTSSKGKTKKNTMKKRKIASLKKEKEKEIDLIRADVEGKIRCCLCGKAFQTMHSLFGHMRRHPDRSWKGIRPPPSPEKFTFSLCNDDDDDDVMSRSSMMFSNVTQDVQEAACVLMMISCNMTSSNYKEMEKIKSEVRSSNDKDLVVDMKIKMEIEVKVNNNPRDETKRSLLGFDLNQPYHHDEDDHPYN